MQDLVARAMEEHGRPLYVVAIGAMYPEWLGYGAGAKNYLAIPDLPTDAAATAFDLKGGTITITSAGSIGGMLATPILNYPEVAILGVYRIKDKPVVREGEIVVRKMTNFTITLDHRIVDGKGAVTFLVRVKEALEDPRRLLMDL